MPMGQLLKSIFTGTDGRNVSVNAQSAAERELRKRRWERSAAYKPCTVIYPSGFKRRGVVMDMSNRGVRIRFTERAGLPDNVRVMVDGFREPRNATVAWHDHIDAGLRFQA
ncbi:MAG: PilZ domain-containing protein [Pseudomonadota bacterium]